MSVNKDFYVICGYDITGCETDKFDDWHWTDDGEKFTCCQRVDKIQLFTDPMAGCYLYLGYIIAHMDEYDDSVKFGVDYMDIEGKFEDVHAKLKHLIEIGVVSENAYDRTPEVFAFIECS